MSNAWLAAIAALTGAVVMVLELMAVRLMAPWFGQSQPVWTSVIGVVLASLAAGQWLGGRWAEARRGPRPALLLLLAGCWSIALPDIVAWLGSAVMPAELPLLEAYPFVTWGSLLVSVVSLGLPLLVLGAMTPWLVQVSTEVRQMPGRVTGRILGAGTLGSLVGTFGATHLLLGTLGSSWAVRVAGALLLVVALVVARLEGRRTGGAGALLGLFLLPVAAAFLPAAGPMKGTLLETRETPYQLARVVEWEDGTRALQLNEGLDSFHSLYNPEKFWSGTYFDAFLGPAFLAPRSADGERDVLVIGLAAGTMARQILEVDPDVRVRGVEIDSGIVELGRRWFDLPDAVDVVEGVDGRIALVADSARYGAILMDAYAQQIYLPAHLCTEEFFASVRDHLLEGGVAALNLGGLGREDPLVSAVAHTFNAVFGNAVMGRVPGTRNMLLMGFRGPAPRPAQWEAALSQVAFPPPEGGVGGLSWFWNSKVLASVGDASEVLLRDGRAPVEALAHESWQGQLVQESALENPVIDAGSLDLARQWIAQTRWSAAEAILREVVLQSSPENQASAHLLLGNIAFERGRFGEAVQEYRAAEAAVGRENPDVRGTTVTAQANIELALSSMERAERLAGRRGRVQIGVLAALGAGLTALLVLVGRSRRLN